MVGGAGLVYKESGVFFRRNFFSSCADRGETCSCVCSADPVFKWCVWRGVVGVISSIYREMSIALCSKVAAVCIVRLLRIRMVFE